MAKKSHKNDTKEFRELSYAEQAKSITAMLNNLHNAMKHHVDHAANPATARQKVRSQASRFAVRVTRI